MNSNKILNNPFLMNDKKAENLKSTLNKIPEKQELKPTPNQRPSVVNNIFQKNINEKVNNNQLSNPGSDKDIIKVDNVQNNAIIQEVKSKNYFKIRVRTTKT